jgi:HPt (histidine-containing phosphotransfer) domain-containing protein
MRQALGAGDRDAVKRVAHSLKGSCGFFGVREVRRLAADLEEYVAHPGSVPDHAADQLDAAFARARVALAAWQS